MIVSAPHMLSDVWMVIGWQQDTDFRSRIDLLAVAPDGSLVLIELKRDRTPRDVVAQALDCASRVENLRADALAAIYGRFAPGRSLAEDLLRRIGKDLAEDSLNLSREVVIVAASPAANAGRIVADLGRLGRRDHRPAHPAFP